MRCFLFSPYDRSLALKRLSNSGIVLSTVESIAFDLIKTADHPNFKEISSVIVSEKKNLNEFAADSFM